MTAPHLIGIGRLGGVDSEGWHHVMIKPEYKSGFALYQDVYLIFASDRVFYVTISDRKQCDKKTWVKFAEDGIAAERKLHREVVLAITEDLQKPDEESTFSLSGYSAVYEGVILGLITDSFFNGAQDVLVISTSFEVDLLVPAVDHYIEDRMDTSKVIFLKNMDDLLFTNDMCIANGKLIPLEL